MNRQEFLSALKEKTSAAVDPLMRHADKTGDTFYLTVGQAIENAVMGFANLYWDEQDTASEEDFQPEKPVSVPSPEPTAPSTSEAPSSSDDGA